MSKEDIIFHQLQRGKELLGMISMDSNTFDLFDQTPLSEYDLYIRKYGHSNAVQVWFLLNFLEKFYSQVSSQTGMDDCEIESQTETVDFTSRVCLAFCLVLYFI